MVSMVDEMVGIGEVTPLEKNPRRHPEKQLKELVNSLAQFGQYRPLVVDEDGVILAGNGLYQALVMSGAEQVSVRRMVGLTEQQRTKLVLADNRLGAMSLDDFDVLDELLRTLDDYEVPGYDPDVIRNLIGTVEDVMEDSEQYGILEAPAREELQDREERVTSQTAQQTVGKPPEPLSEEQIAASGGTCPTCNRPW